MTTKKTCIEKLIEEIPLEYINSIAPDGIPLLHILHQNSWHDLVQRMLDKGADPFIKNSEGLSYSDILEKDLHPNIKLLQHFLPGNIARTLYENQIDPLLFDLKNPQNYSFKTVWQLADKIDWKTISYNNRQTFSEDFIREFQDKVDWGYISYRQTLSDRKRVV